MGLLKRLTEGGQVWAHRMRMTRQVIKIALLISFLISAGSFIINMARIPPVCFQALGYFIKSKTLGRVNEEISVDAEFWKKATRQAHAKETLSLKSKAVEAVCKRYVDLLGNKTSEHFTSAGKLGIFSFVGILSFFCLQGWRARRKRLLEGKAIVPDWRLALTLKLSGNASPIKIGSLPLVKGTETQHILISGATGMGKTNAIHHILAEIKNNKQRAIIIDTSGELVQRYYREGKDVLLNPLDPRGAPWHPWCEGSEKTDFKALANGFIPSTYREEENFWRKGAQEVFYSALIEKSQEKKTSSLTRILLYDSLSTLSTVLKGSAATPYLDLSSEKTAGSVRAVASGFLECLELIRDTETPFSIKEWVQNENSDSWLFLSSTVKQRASMIPLLSAWLSIAIQGLLQMQPDPNRRLWFILDELPRLSRLNDLEAFITEARKYGGCGILAIQSPSQLEAIYGKEITRTIIGNVGTRIAFAEYDPEIAQLISRSFGEKEVNESQEAISYGAHEMRDGVNLSFQNKASPCVSPSAIQSLNPHEAFVKFPGKYPISKIKLDLLDIS